MMLITKMIRDSIPQLKKYHFIYSSDLKYYLN
jgi:hypothetical protein